MVVIGVVQHAVKRTNKGMQRIGMGLGMEMEKCWHRDHLESKPTLDGA